MNIIFYRWSNDEVILNVQRSLLHQQSEVYDQIQSMWRFFFFCTLFKEQHSLTEQYYSHSFFFSLASIHCAYSNAEVPLTFDTDRKQQKFNRTKKNVRWSHNTFFGLCEFRVFTNVGGQTSSANSIEIRIKYYLFMRLTDSLAFVFIRTRREKKKKKQFVTYLWPY